MVTVGIFSQSNIVNIKVHQCRNWITQLVKLCVKLESPCFHVAVRREQGGGRGRERRGGGAAPSRHPEARRQGRHCGSGASS